MPSLLFYLWLLPVIIAAGVLLFVFWDKRRVMVVGEDPVTGKTKKAKVTPKSQGIPWKKGPGPDLMIDANRDHMGTWVGWFFERPYIKINARTGNPMETVTVEEDAEPEDLADLAERLRGQATPKAEDADLPGHVSLLAEKPWAAHYFDLIDSEAMRQAAEAQKPPWQTIQFTLFVVGFVGMAMGYLVALATGVGA